MYTVTLKNPYFTKNTKDFVNEKNFLIQTFSITLITVIISFHTKFTKISLKN